MRTFFKYLLAVLGVIFAMGAIVQTTTWLLVGTPAHVASTAVRLIESPEGGPVIGRALVDQLLEGADAETVAVIAPKRDELALAAAGALGRSQDELTGIVQQVIGAGQGTVVVVVDIKPVMAKVLAAMNAVEPQVPTDVEGEMSLEINPTDIQPVTTAVAGLNAWWVSVILALALLAGAGLCSRRPGLGRLRVSGISLAVASVIVIGLVVGGGFAVRGMSFDDAAGQALANAVSGLVQSTVLMVGGIALAIAALVIVLGVVIKPRRPAPASE